MKIFSFSITFPCGKLWGRFWESFSIKILSISIKTLALPIKILWWEALGKILGELFN